jgi:NTP pyrophosphatase (non-canonical NTP hydrolase)
MTSSHTVGQMPLDAFVDAVNRIYRDKDLKRSIWDVWMHANHHASGIAEEIRKGRSGNKLLTEIADFAMWLLTAIHKLVGEVGIPKPGDSGQESVIRIGHKYSDLLWNRFPGCCPLCYWRRSEGGREKERDPRLCNPCDCLRYEAEELEKTERRKRVKGIRSFSKTNRELQPHGIDDWQRMFARIFSPDLLRFNLTDIAFRILEEMGQVSDALVRTYTYNENEWVYGEPSWRQIFLEDALADVSARLFTLVQKLEILKQSTIEDRPTSRLMVEIGEAGLKLSGIIWQRYGSDDLGDFMCPFCGAKICDGAIIFVPPDRSVKDLRDLIADSPPT